MLLFLSLLFFNDKLLTVMIKMRLMQMMMTVLTTIMLMMMTTMVKCLLTVNI